MSSLASTALCSSTPWLLLLLLLLLPAIAPAFAQVPSSNYTCALDIRFAEHQVFKARIGIPVNPSILCRGSQRTQMIKDVQMTCDPGAADGNSIIKMEQNPESLDSFRYKLDCGKRLEDSELNYAVMFVLSTTPLMSNPRNVHCDYHLHVCHGEEKMSWHFHVALPSFKLKLLCNTMLQPSVSRYCDNEENPTKLNMTYKNPDLYICGWNLVCPIDVAGPDPTPSNKKNSGCVVGTEMACGALKLHPGCIAPFIIFLYILVQSG
ncbi:uncharacterized protein LOC116952761 [Petromyzon marinus]|uniref:Uncharacterized protein LOC116952761 isoform X1 n=1 Tax=Petromyzon marinus TaxID=7757 RepID=A0AAJ7XBI3_PETMA|nr:uncharacterized protein LOC116952761 isoform X1 [Petromyzon marinus]